jgi:hypothetical protein
VSASAGNILGRSSKAVQWYILAQFKGCETSPTVQSRFLVLACAADLGASTNIAVSPTSSHLTPSQQGQPHELTAANTKTCVLSFPPTPSTPQRHFLSPCAKTSFFFLVSRRRVRPASHPHSPVRVLHCLRLATSPTLPSSACIGRCP